MKEQHIYDLKQTQLALNKKMYYIQDVTEKRKEDIVELINIKNLKLCRDSLVSQKEDIESRIMELKRNDENQNQVILEKKKTKGKTQIKNLQVKKKK